MRRVAVTCRAAPTFARSFARILGCVVACASAVQAQPTAERTQKVRVAVLDLSGSALKLQSSTMAVGGPQPPYGQPAGQQTTVSIDIPPPAEFARGLTEMLTSILVKTGRFVVLERAAMQQIDQEQAIGAAGKTTRESAAKSGGLLGAQALVTGDITGFAFARSSLGGKLTNLVKGLTVAAERVSAEVTVDLRLIDATTGEVIYSAKGSGKVAQTGVATDMLKEEKNYSADATMTTPLGLASRQAIQNAIVAILVGMPKIRWSGRVVDVREGVVYVNAVASDGMRPGLVLDVYEIQPVLLDPDTGKSLGSPERHIGTVTIDAVLEKFSTARVTTGTGVARGQALRFRTP